MKKIILLLSGLALLFPFTSCDKEDDDAAAEQEWEKTKEEWEKTSSCYITNETYDDITIKDNEGNKLAFIEKGFSKKFDTKADITLNVCDQSGEIIMKLNSGYHHYGLSKEEDKNHKISEWKILEDVNTMTIRCHIINFTSPSNYFDNVKIYSLKYIMGSGDEYEYIATLSRGETYTFKQYFCSDGEYSHLFKIQDENGNSVSIENPFYELQEQGKDIGKSYEIDCTLKVNSVG